MRQRMRERSNSSSQGDVKLQILKQWCVEDYSQNKKQQMIEKTEELWRGKKQEMFQIEKAVRRKTRQKRSAIQNWKLESTNTNTQGEVGEMSNIGERRKNNKRRRGGVNRDRSCGENEQISKENLGMCQKEGFHFFHKWTVILQHILLGIKCQS